MHRPTLPALVGALAGITPNAITRQLPQEDPYLHTAQMLVAHIALVPLAEDDPLPTPVAHLLSDSGEVPVAYEGGPELEHEAKPKKKGPSPALLAGKKGTPVALPTKGSALRTTKPAKKSKAQPVKAVSAPAAVDREAQLECRPVVVALELVRA